MELIFIKSFFDTILSILDIQAKRIQDIFRYLRLNRKLINRDKINLNQILSI